MWRRARRTSRRTRCRIRRRRRRLSPPRPSAGGLRIGWTDPDDAAIDGWYFRYRAGNGSFGAWAEIDNLAADTEDASRLVFDTTDESVTLANGTVHAVEIRAGRSKYLDADNQLQTGDEDGPGHRRTGDRDAVRDPRPNPPASKRRRA